MSTFILFGYARSFQIRSQWEVFRLSERNWVPSKYDTHIGDQAKCHQDITFVYIIHVRAPLNEDVGSISHPVRLVTYRFAVINLIWQRTAPAQSYNHRPWPNMRAPARGTPMSTMRKRPLWPRRRRGRGGWQGGGGAMGMTSSRTCTGGR